MKTSEALVDINSQAPIGTGADGTRRAIAIFDCCVRFLMLIVWLSVLGTVVVGVCVAFVLFVGLRCAQIVAKRLPGNLRPKHIN